MKKSNFKFLTFFLYFINLFTMETPEQKIIYVDNRGNEIETICRGIFEKSCAHAHSVIKIVNKSRKNICIKVTFAGHPKHLHSYNSRGTYTPTRDKKLTYYLCSNNFYLGYDDVPEFEGPVHILEHDQEIDIKPQNFLKNNKIIHPDEICCVTKIHARPILEGKFANFRSIRQATTLKNVERINSNCFSINTDSETNKLSIQFANHHWLNITPSN